MTRHPSRLLVAGLTLALLAGCSSDRGTNADSGNKAAAGSSSNQGLAGDPPKDGAANADNGASGIGIDSPDPSKAIFSKQFAIPGKPQRKVTVGILSLERKDRMAILKVVVTPDFADEPASKTVTFREAMGDTSWFPTLLDLKNLKKYNVLSGTGGYLSFDDGEAVSGQPIYAWAVFAAPPAAVTSLDLTMVDWMPRITNVPIR